MARTTQSQEMINAGIMVQGINVHAETRKIIKLDVPQTLWREFGIDDKR